MRSTARTAQPRGSASAASQQVPDDDLAKLLAEIENLSDDEAAAAVGRRAATAIGCLEQVTCPRRQACQFTNTSARTVNGKASCLCIREPRPNARVRQREDDQAPLRRGRADARCCNRPIARPLIRLLRAELRLPSALIAANRLERLCRFCSNDSRTSRPARKSTSPKRHTRAWNSVWRPSAEPGRFHRLRENRGKLTLFSAADYTEISFSGTIS